MTLTFKGLQVPWVTRWTNEVPDGAKFDVIDELGGINLRYTDGIEFRDDHGVLWQREGIGRGGEPQFAHVSAHRQRAAMRQRRCQVCGHRISDQPIRWLMDPGQLTHLDDGTALTVSPPTCSSCVDVALNACPHLRSNDRLILTVLEYRIWGVWGEVVRRVPGESGPVLQRAKGVNVAYERTDLDGLGSRRYLNSVIARHLKSVIAKQQVVQLTKFTIEANT